MFRPLHHEQTEALNPEPIDPYDDSKALSSVLKVWLVDRGTTGETKVTKALLFTTRKFHQ